MRNTADLLGRESKPTNRRIVPIVFDGIQLAHGLDGA
jgi:hypothetical protein